MQFRLGTTLGHNTLFKVVRSLSRSFFGRKGLESSAATDTPAVSDRLWQLAEVGLDAPAQIAPPALRSFSERGLIEYVVEDETVTRAIDLQLKTLLFNLEKVVFGSFANPPETTHIRASRQAFDKHGSCSWESGGPKCSGAPRDGLDAPEGGPGRSSRAREMTPARDNTSST